MNETFPLATVYMVIIPTTIIGHFARDSKGRHSVPLLQDASGFDGNPTLYTWRRDAEEAALHFHGAIVVAVTLYDRPNKSEGNPQDSAFPAVIFRDRRGSPLCDKTL